MFSYRIRKATFMKNDMTQIKSFFIMLIVLVVIPTCFADNPIIQTIYTADPAPFVYNGRVYLYLDHDEDGSTNFNLKDWRVFSSVDMVNWTDHGSPLSLKSFSWAQSNAWAGQAVFRNGKFYWYVPITKTTGGQETDNINIRNLEL